jgi:MYXO-CTERM domain-containing protein
MKKQVLTLTLASLLMAMNANALTLLNTYVEGNVTRTGGSEILSYTTQDNTLLATVANATTSAFGVQIMTLSSGATLSERAYIDYSGTFGATANISSISSVAADPANRGFGVATLIPTANTSTQGKIAFYDLTSGFSGGSRNLVTLDVGFHPDSVTFSADGTKLVIVNEGEFNAGVANPSTTGNAAGSISVIDLTSITNTAGIAALTNGNVSTFDFSSGNLDTGVNLNGIRNSSAAALGLGTASAQAFIADVPNFTTLAGSDPDFFKGMEPEFATVLGNKVHVTLQENNAIATFDLGTNKWTAVRNLGTITQTIDASDQDGPSISINDTVKGLPMPDTMRAFTSSGTNYLITVNEGDARGDDRDISRFGDTSGGDSMNSILAPGLVSDPSRANSVMGRLNVSRLDGDTGANGGIAGDGKIDEAVMIGTRSMTIWNADTGAKVWDSGQSTSTNFETLLATLDPTRFNMNNGNPANFDTRSDDKGPEPEALTIGQFGSSLLAFVGMERQNGLMVYDITDVNNPTFVSYLNSQADGLISPESMVYIPAGQSPTGSAVLLTGYEGTGSLGSGIGVYSVPEPSRALLGLLGLGLVALRRRRA